MMHSLLRWDGWVTVSLAHMGLLLVGFGNLILFFQRNCKWKAITAGPKMGLVVLAKFGSSAGKRGQGIFLGEGDLDYHG